MKDEDKEEAKRKSVIKAYNANLCQHLMIDFFDFPSSSKMYIYCLNIISKPFAHNALHLNT